MQCRINVKLVISVAPSYSKAKTSLWTLTKWFVKFVLICQNKSQVLQILLHTFMYTCCKAMNVTKYKLLSYDQLAVIFKVV